MLAAGESFTRIGYVNNFLSGFVAQEWLFQSQVKSQNRQKSHRRHKRQRAESHLCTDAAEVKDPALWV